MDVIIIMILSSISLGVFFLIFFLFSLYSGQFDDYDSYGVRILIDDNLNDEVNNKITNNEVKS